MSIVANIASLCIAESVKTFGKVSMFNKTEATGEQGRFFTLEGEDDSYLSVNKLEFDEEKDACLVRTVNGDIDYEIQGRFTKEQWPIFASNFMRLAQETRNLETAWFESCEVAYA